jgi:hypothetical protein
VNRDAGEQGRTRPLRHCSCRLRWSCPSYSYANVIWGRTLIASGFLFTFISSRGQRIRTGVGGRVAAPGSFVICRELPGDRSVFANFLLQRLGLPGELLIGGKELPQMDEGPDDLNAGAHRHGIFENVRKHHRPVFGEHARRTGCQEPGARRNVHFSHKTRREHSVREESNGAPFRRGSASSVAVCPPPFTPTAGLRASVVFRFRQRPSLPFRSWQPTAVEPAAKRLLSFARPPAG